MQGQEIREAIYCCDRVVEKIDVALDQLKHARNWGLADMLGGGFLISLFKHGKLDQVEMALTEVERELKVLQRELKDVSGNIRLSLNNTELNRFFDVFVDNIFSDLNTQSKIGKATNELYEIKGDVKELRRQLEIRQEQL